MLGHAEHHHGGESSIGKAKVKVNFIARRLCSFVFPLEIKVRTQMAKALSDSGMCETGHPFMYIVKNIIDGAVTHVHVNYLHVFFPPGNKSDEACKCDEFLVCEVLSHCVDPDGEICFHVFWEGYPNNSDGDDNVWVC